MKWIRRLKLLKMSNVIIAACACLSAVFAGFTIYGSQAGNFVINTDQGDIKLGLTLDADQADIYSRLTLSGLDGLRDSTYNDIPKDIYEGIGDKNDYDRNNYIAYSFYLVNKSKRAVDYNVSLKVVNVNQNPLDILRIMLIRGDGEQTDIFARPESTQAGEDQLLANTDYTTTDFVSDSVLLYMEEYNFQPNDMVKYTLVLWMEGWDIECVDSAIGGRVRLALDFTGM